MVKGSKGEGRHRGILSASSPVAMDNYIRFFFFFWRRWIMMGAIRDYGYFCFK
jgi:hypothetical protein